MVVLTTSETTTSGVLAVLSNTTVTGRDVAAVLTSLGEPGRHFLREFDQRVSVQSLVQRSVIRSPSNPSSITTSRSGTTDIRFEAWDA